MSHADGQADQLRRESARAWRRRCAAAYGKSCNDRPRDYNGDASYQF